MTDKRIGSDGGGIQHHSDSSRSGFAGPKVLPDGPNWLDPRDTTRRVGPGQLGSLVESEAEALDWEEDDEETSMWSDRHLAPRASVLSPKLSSQREAIARRFRQREALYASSRYEGTEEGETDDSAEDAGGHPPEAQKRYVYRSHLPLEPDDFIPTLAEPMHLASLPLPIEPEPEYSADATEDFDLDEVLSDDDSDAGAWAPPLGARPGSPHDAARTARPSTQQPPTTVARRMPTVDYPQMRPLHETYAPSRARAATPRPRSTPDQAAAQPHAADPRWAMLGAEAQSSASLTQPVGAQRGRHDAAAPSPRGALPEPASGSVRGPRRGTPPMGVVLRRDSQPAARAPQHRPDFEQSPPMRTRSERPSPAAPHAMDPAAQPRGPQPFQPTVTRAAPPHRAAARAPEHGGGAPQATAARPRHTHTVRFVAAPPQGGPRETTAPRETSAPRPATATQTFTAQRGAQVAAAQRQPAVQPSRGEQPRQPSSARPAGRRPTPTQQFVAARPHPSSHDAVLHVPPQPSRAQLGQPIPTRQLAPQASQQPQLARSRMNTVSYEDLPRRANQLAAGQVIARNVQPTRAPQPSSVHALAQQAQPVHERLPRVARQEARRAQAQTATLRAPIALQAEPLTLRGLQPARSLQHTRPGLQPERSQAPQLRAQPAPRLTPMQAYAPPPQAVPAPALEPVRALRQRAPALDPVPQAWPTLEDDAPFEPRRSGRGRSWLLGSMTAAGLLGSIVVGRLLLSAPTPATLAIETLPFDASVTIDGRPLPGTRSPYRAQDLQAGEHLLIVQKAGFVTHTERVTVREGEERRLSTLVLTPEPPLTAIPLQPVAATPALPSETAAKPERSRRHSRSADADEPRERPERSAHSANHGDSSRAADPTDEPEVVERASSKRHSEQESTAASERSAPASEALEEGMLRINSRPWAEVYIDGKRVGTTPQMGLRLRPGQHKVELVNPELEMRKSMVIEIEPGELTTRIVTLQE